jgi:hypothetical protein
VPITIESAPLSMWMTAVCRPSTGNVSCPPPPLPSPEVRFQTMSTKATPISTVTTMSCHRGRTDRPAEVESPDPGSSGGNSSAAGSSGGADPSAAHPSLGIAPRTDTDPSASDSPDAAQADEDWTDTNSPAADSCASPSGPNRCSTDPLDSFSVRDPLDSSRVFVPPGLVPPTGAVSPDATIGADPATPDLFARTLPARAIRVAAVIETDSALRRDSAALAAASASGSTGIGSVGVGSMYAMPSIRMYGQLGCPKDRTVLARRT